MDKSCLKNSYRHVVQEFSGNSRKVSARIDAIYIPCRGRTDYLCELLEQISWYEGKIYVLATDIHNLSFVSEKYNIGLVTEIDSDFSLFYSRLNTSKNKFIDDWLNNWDLPIKRSFAIVHAIKNRHKKILFIDDDIEGISRDLLFKLENALDEYSLAGCFVNEFPDTSVQGHLEIMAGIKVEPFISGSFLGINTSESTGFFPLIYNEDWIFISSYLLNSKVCSVGLIKQKPYNPFLNRNLIKHQEFGEIIAEGLYLLIDEDRNEDKYRESYWRNIILSRKNTYSYLKTIIPEDMHDYLNKGIRSCESIFANDCISYLRDLDSDINSWSNLLSRHRKWKMNLR